ncbi:MAG: DUF2235 domain-containing protein [Pseudomonadota bacterium]
MSSRSPRILVHIVDGTLSSLAPGCETHAGRLRNWLAELGPRPDLALGYHPGVQGQGFARWLRAATGAGLNDAICHGYAHIASRFRPGDRIFLFGYSRGAYAVRSLAGLIDRVGLLRPEQAIERRVHRAFRLYESGSPRARAAFAARHCHPGATVEMIGAWDTVKALGLPWPVLSRLHPMATEFHDHELGPHIRNAFHALALDEDRTAFDPVLWTRAPGPHGRIEQLWFPGAHGDVGGMLDGYEAARPLADIPFQWMLEQAESLGLPLPEGWRGRLSPDPTAPMLGPRSGIGRLFLLRRPRRVSAHPGEDLHPSVAARMAAAPAYAPRADGLAAQA